VSAICVSLVIVATRQVLLALVVAYVLTPAVCRVEKQGRMPRRVAILLVYAATLGTIGGFIARAARKTPQFQRLSVHARRRRHDGG
jgi:predicted PurR-regulated permease PerM